MASLNNIYVFITTLMKYVAVVTISSMDKFNVGSTIIEQITKLQNQLGVVRSGLQKNSVKQANSLALHSVTQLEIGNFR